MKRVTLIVTFLSLKLMGQVFVGPVYSTLLLKKSLVSAQFNNTDKFSWNQPIQTFGINVGARGAFSAWSNARPQISFSAIRRQELFLSDTTRAQIAGFCLGLSPIVLDWPFLRRKNAGVYFAILSFNTGKVELTAEDFVKKNTFFSPRLGVQPWIKFYRMLFIISVNYEWDISNPKWHQQAGSNLPLRPNHQGFTGVSVSAALHYIFKKEKSTPKTKRKPKKRKIR